MAFLIAAPGYAADDPPTEFSKTVTAVLGDWNAEDWRRGIIMLHPARYNDNSDYYVKLYAEEPAMGRTAAGVLKTHFEGDDLGDDSVNPTKIDLRRAKEAIPGILMLDYTWNYAFDTNFGFWGVVTTANNSFVPFHAQCQKEDSDRPTDYPLKTCVEKMFKSLLLIQAGQLRVPEPPQPLSIVGYDSQYLPDGSSYAVNSNYNGLRKATIRVTPPLVMNEAQLVTALQSVSESMVDSISDFPEKGPGIFSVVGTEADPWIRREFPQAMDGGSIVMTGSVKTADGKTSIIGVRCPNKGWLATCAYGVEQAKLQVRSGQLEARRQKIIAATQVPLPPNGLKNSQIFGIYTKGRNTMGYGGFMTGYVIDGPMLMKDGRVTNDYDRPIAFIDPAVDAPKKPGSWGRWTRAGNKVNITWGDGDTDSIDATNDNLMVGGPQGMKIAGYYKHVSGGGNAISGSGYLSSSSYSFFADGTFESDKSNSFSVGGFDGGGSPAIIASGGSSGGNGRGTYAVDGFTLTLTFPDGRVSRRMIAVYAKDIGNIKRSTIMLDGTVYFLDTD